METEEATANQGRVAHRSEHLSDTQVAGRFNSSLAHMTDLTRLRKIDELYNNPDDPMAKAEAQFKEILRQYMMKLGLCEACLAKLPDPL